MRKLKIIEHISLDGVIQHSADDGDFPYSDWTAPYRTPAGRDLVTAAHGERFALRPAVPGQEHLPPSLLRLSVGIEHGGDLWADLQAALALAAA